jgi:cellulose biosynthesis protein BcsS
MMLKESVALSALVVVASAGVATAADMPLKAPSAGPEKIEYGNLYSGVDWTSHRSLVGYMGVLYAPNGMEQSGLRLSAFGLTGQYRYQGDTGGFRGQFVSTDAMLGWSNVFDDGALTSARLRCGRLGRFLRPGGGRARQRSHRSVSPRRSRLEHRSGRRQAWPFERLDARARRGRRLVRDRQYRFQLLNRRTRNRPACRAVVGRAAPAVVRCGSATAWKKVTYEVFIGSGVVL